MADSINRIVPPSVAIERAAQFGKERRRNSGEDQLRRQDHQEKNRVAQGSQETPANHDAKPAQNKIKGKHLDIRA